MGPHKRTLEDLFLEELSEFDNALKKQELIYGESIYNCSYRDEKYLTQKIEILIKFAKRCVIIRDVLSEDLDLLEVVQMLAR